MIDESTIRDFCITSAAERDSMRAELAAAAERERVLRSAVEEALAYLDDGVCLCRLEAKDVILTVDLCIACRMNAALRQCDELNQRREDRDASPIEEDR